MCPFHCGSCPLRMVLNECSFITVDYVLYLNEVSKGFLCFHIEVGNNFLFEHI